jgi:hypothetical protein
MSSKLFYSFGSGTRLNFSVRESNCITKLSHELSEALRHIQQLQKELDIANEKLEAIRRVIQISASSK